MATPRSAHRSVARQLAARATWVCDLWRDRYRPSARGRGVSTKQRTVFCTGASAISLEKAERRRVEANAAFDVITERLSPNAQPHVPPPS
jgi:hypothetical protein